MNPIFVAIDTPSMERARFLAAQVREAAGGVKLGLEFFSANGPEGVASIAALGLPVFLDVKLHDIPNTVAKAVEALARKRVKRIVLARPAVEAGESLGFLPGDLQQKVDPYLRPLYDALEDMMPNERVQRALEARVIEIAPLAYMRGRTLNDAFIILDEAQNATGAQMKMFLTRLGVNSKVVVTGDKTQIDLPKREDSGLVQIERILPGIDGIAFHYLTDADVVRHRLVKEIVRAYAEDQAG